MKDTLLLTVKNYDTNFKFFQEPKNMMKFLRILPPKELTGYGRYAIVGAQLYAAFKNALAQIANLKGGQQKTFVRYDYKLGRRIHADKCRIFFFSA